MRVLNDPSLHVCILLDNFTLIFGTNVTCRVASSATFNISLKAGSFDLTVVLGVVAYDRSSIFCLAGLSSLS